MLSLKILKQHLQERPAVSLQELQTLLQEDAETIGCLLKYFIDRGQVQERALTSQCGVRCQKCPSAATRIYHWKPFSASLKIVS